jgi:hypothetical protein
MITEQADTDSLRQAATGAARDACMAARLAAAYRGRRRGGPERDARDEED